MGQAFDATGQVLGEAAGDTKREVFDKLTEAHPARAGKYATSPAPERISLDNVDHIFTYQPWNAQQAARGAEVREALIAAAKAILRNVPECPSRTRALNHLIDARMIANQTITHDGRF